MSSDKELFRFTLNDTGIGLACISLATFLITEAENPNLSFRIEFVNHPHCFVEYDKGCLKCVGLKSDYQKQIEDVLLENNLSLSKPASQAESHINPNDEAFINGLRKISVGTRVQFQTLRDMFPEMADEELIQIFHPK